MICINYLGKRYERLANQMFQYAAVKGIAKNRGFEFCIPYHQHVFDDGIGNKLRIELFDPFVMKNVTQLNIQTIDKERPVTIDSKFSFEDAPKAHRHIQDRKNFGKVLLDFTSI